MTSTVSHSEISKICSHINEMINDRGGGSVCFHTPQASSAIYRNGPYIVMLCYSPIGPSTDLRSPVHFAEPQRFEYKKFNTDMCGKLFEFLKSVEKEEPRCKCIVVCNGAVSSVLELVEESHDHKIEVWNYKHFVYNPTRNILVPRHRKISKEEIVDLFGERVDVSLFPRILSSDIISRYYAFEVGDVVEITRDNNEKFYRVVVQGEKQSGRW